MRNSPPIIFDLGGEVSTNTLIRAFICSHCHHKLDSLPLSVRNWTCPSCQAEHDRDVNAASNIRKQALADVAGLATV